ncbi:uncharacterized protein LOC120281128 [Dioscorea cayenensis subsp. rotundata]|uniref:Uncharacterized protein LOC120281128 n=1 Tax=Dioscorea cayennensis subsp. rotundata TaxID=55577 RepID=A0AB40CX52_DIOCR|nr:uncharacterized protein LOC120281128 [Dioscorea cayenensis subsp. rotundata]
MVKLLGTRIINPISDSVQMSLTQVVSKKEGMIMIKNERKELIPSKRVTGWSISIALEDQENTTFTCLYWTFAYRRMPFGLYNALATFQKCMTAIFDGLLVDIMKVFMDDFPIFRNSFEVCLKNLWCTFSLIVKELGIDFLEMVEVFVVVGLDSKKDLGGSFTLVIGVAIGKS